MRALIPLVLAAAVLAGCAGAEPPPVGVVQPALPEVAANPAIAALAPPELRGSGALRVAVPFESGAERELAEALADRLGLVVVPDGVSAAALPRALFEGRHDLGVSPNAAEPPRGAEEVPWLAARSALVTPPGNPDRVEATTLCGHRIGVVAGSVQHAEARQKAAHCGDNRLPALEIVTVAGALDATRRLLDDGLDAFLADAPAAGHAVVAGMGKLEIPSTPWGEGTGAIIAAPAVAAAVRAALDSLIADGTYEVILQRWLLTDQAVPPTGS